MAKEENEEPRFDDLEFSTEDEVAENPLDGLVEEPASFDDILPEQDFVEVEESVVEAAPADVFDAEVAPDLAEKAEEEEVTELDEVETIAAAEPAPSKLPFFIEMASLAGVPLLLFVLAFLQVIFVPTAVWLIGVGLIPYGIWKWQAADVYTVFLGCVVAAILTAVYFLWLELGQYHYDVKASTSRQRAALMETVESPRLSQMG